MKRDQRHKILLVLFFSSSLIVSVPQANAQALRLNGSSSLVDADNNTALRLLDFTLESWIKIEGRGRVGASGAGGGGAAGLNNLIPLITRGRSDLDGTATREINYYFAYDSATRRLAADFEDRNASNNNHGALSNIVLDTCTWIHVAVTCKGSTGGTRQWVFYVNGVLRETIAITGATANEQPQDASLASLTFGSAINVTAGGVDGTAVGFFQGKMDEIRVWNLVRTPAEIASNYNLELASGTGLVGRWSLSEGTGTTTANSIPGYGTGTLVSSPGWTKNYNYTFTGTSALDFDGLNDYVTFGAAPTLNSGNSLTLEAWIKIEGTGVTTSTGSGGLEGVNVAVPIVAKGRSEADAPLNINCNYFMGITASGQLAADFEDNNNGLNHPVIGNTVLQPNIWYHVAATYGLNTWNLYVNGVLDKNEAELGFPPVVGSIQHASIGSALNSTGVSAGFFNGKIDEVRIWSTVRSATEIANNMNDEINDATNLQARFSLNENQFNYVENSSNQACIPFGTITNGAVWTGTNFNPPPFQPTNPNPADGTIGWPGAIINVDVVDRNGQPLTVKLFGRKKNASAVPNFTMIGLPDTQFYTEEPQGVGGGGGGHNGIFKSQTAWIAAHRVDSNIKFTVQLGDCVEHGNANEIEWRRADTAIKNIENPAVPIPDGIPYSICVGNHDQGATGNGNPNDPTTFYNQYFGEARFTGRAYYGGHYGTNNDNSFQLISAGGIDFITFSIEYNDNSDATEQATLQGVLNWVDSLLKAHPNRKGILSTHWLMGTGLNGAFQGPGQKIYDDLKDNPNLMLMLCGHVAGQGRRTDVFNGNTVHTLLSDYQSGFTNGGNGYLRIMQFKPASNTLSVTTYSPYANAFLSNANGLATFDLTVNLSPGFVEIATDPVSSGGTAELWWDWIETNTEYEWYVTVSDGENVITSPIRSFISAGIIPIKLLDFNATVENNQVKLKWNTASETNSKQFDIERSRDGKNFTRVSTVKAKGNSNSIEHYNDIDAAPFRGTSYYRLKQLDINGRFVYSPIERVNLYAKGIEVYPNPVTGSEININFLEETKGTLEVNVFDVNGKLRMTRRSSVNNNNMVLRHILTPGIYIVKIRTDEQEFSKKIVIK